MALAINRSALNAGIRTVVFARRAKFRSFFTARNRPNVFRPSTLVPRRKKFERADWRGRGARKCLDPSFLNPCNDQYFRLNVLVLDSFLGLFRRFVAFLFAILPLFSLGQLDSYVPCPTALRWSWLLSQGSLRYRHISRECPRPVPA